MNSLLLVLGSFLAAQDPEPPNLLRNPSVEEGRAPQPDGWEQSGPVPGVRYRWTEGNAADGRRALAMHKEGEQYLPVAAWQQEVAHAGKATKIHFGALVRADEVRKAVLDVGFRGADGTWRHAWAAYIGARDETSAPVTHDWQWYSGVVAIPAGTTALRFALQMYGPGEAAFDRLRAVTVDKRTPPTDPLRVRAEPADAWGSLPQEAAATAEADPPAPRTVDGDAQRRWFLHPPAAAATGNGHGLLVVLPGGDGSVGFHGFVRGIAREAVPRDYVVVQLVAPAHARSAELVWPKRSDRVAGVAHATEDFVLAVIAAVAKEHRIDRQRTFLLGWSSGGPPSYALAVDPRAPIAGALVAMSVFQPEKLGKLAGAKGRAFYLLHSPQDAIAMTFPKRAAADLGQAGARTKLVLYEGGHGWHGDAFARIGAGVRWLEANAGRR